MCKPAISSLVLYMYRGYIGDESGILKRIHLWFLRHMHTYIYEKQTMGHLPCQFTISLSLSIYFLFCISLHFMSPRPVSEFRHMTNSLPSCRRPHPSSWEECRVIFLTPSSPWRRRRMTPSRKTSPGTCRGPWGCSHGVTSSRGSTATTPTSTSTSLWSPRTSSWHRTPRAVGRKSDYFYVF